MFSFSKKGWTGLAALAFFISLATMQSFTAPTAVNAVGCTCNAPSNSSITDQTSSSVSLAWSAVFGSSAYEAWYYRFSDGYTSPATSVSTNAITFTGLSAGRYLFYGKSICGGGSSDFVILEDMILD